MRTIIDLPEPLLHRLDGLCRKQGISRAEAVRRAVARHVQAEGGGFEPWFGLWSDRDTDAVAYQQALRREWDREP